jgi:hypothetical protein
MSTEAMVNKLNAAIQYDKEVIDELNTLGGTAAAVANLVTAQRYQEDVIGRVGKLEGGSGDAPPAGNAPDGYTPLLLPDVHPDGERVVSGNFEVGQMAMAKLVVPEGLASNRNTIAVFEFDSPPTARRAWLSKKAWDVSSTTQPFYLTDTGPVFNYSIGMDPPPNDCVPMVAGETWYLMVVNEKPFPPHDPSGHPGQNLQIGIKMYPTY